MAVRLASRDSIESGALSFFIRHRNMLASPSPDEMSGLRTLRWHRSCLSHSGAPRPAASIGCCGQRGIKLCAWRGHTSRPACQIKALPYDARLMRCYPVSTRINYVVNDELDSFSTSALWIECN
jgi:hypothetical protein